MYFLVPEHNLIDFNLPCNKDPLNCQCPKNLYKLEIIFMFLPSSSYSKICCINENMVTL